MGRQVAKGFRVEAVGPLGAVDRDQGDVGVFFRQVESSRHGVHSVGSGGEACREIGAFCRRGFLRILAAEGRVFADATGIPTSGLARD